MPAIGLPFASTPTSPKIWVGELSFWIWNVPSESAKPPVWKVGTASAVILLLLAKKVVRTTQLTFLLCTGCTVSAASSPRSLSALFELKI